MSSKAIKTLGSQQKIRVGRVTGNTHIFFFYALCFRADRKNKMATLVSDWLRHFWLLLWNHWTKFNETWQEARSQHPLPSLCFWADRKNKMAALASDWLKHFQLLFWNHWMACNETWLEERSQCPLPLPSSFFLGWSEKQDGRPGQSVKEVAHCTQVHDIWPFGPLVLLCVYLGQVWNQRLWMIQHAQSVTVQSTITVFTKTFLGH